MCACFVCVCVCVRVHVCVSMHVVCSYVFNEYVHMHAHGNV